MIDTPEATHIRTASVAESEAQLPAGWGRHPSGP